MWVFAFCSIYLLSTGAVFSFDVRVCVCVCLRERETGRGDG